MQLRKIMLSYKSVEAADFEAGPFTVLFGRNNSGKTNILEGLHRIFESKAVSGRRHEDQYGMESPPEGALWVDLEQGVDFDDKVMAAVSDSLPAEWSRRVAFTSQGPFVIPSDQEDFASVRAFIGAHFLDRIMESTPGTYTLQKVLNQGSRLRTLFLDWEFTDLNERIETAVGGDWLHELDEAGEPKAWIRTKPLEPPNTTRPKTWSWNREMITLLEQITGLATDLLPDFVTVSIEAWVNQPNDWEEHGKVDLRCSEDGLPVESLGQGMTRWIATAVQIALYLIGEHPQLRMLRGTPPGTFSGQILLVDEPEAHLHPSAVASVVRWCQRMVRHGFTVLVSSHHEEFLRAADDDVTLVHVTREVSETLARTLPSRRTSLLLELASDIGIHPASTLSLHSAVLFVEGPLDQAVLEELGSLELEAAGVKIIPIHGTKNLEGLVATELVTELGMNIGVLTDATDSEEMHKKSGTKRSSEERKVMKVLKMAEEKGLPAPKSFGVHEADLLFALPADAITAYLGRPFPGWKELVAECREAEGMGPSDSVNWKAYARKHYGLSIDSAPGVRSIIRALDLDGVQLPSIRKVIDDVANWGRRSSGRT
jgi:energy-coupling factor transporter ATP-binding protein EcfA2